MTDNIEEEHSDETINSSSENPSAESMFAKDGDTMEPNQENEIMEVHHHSHVGKKNFKEYLLEGLMIFIAVMMGFFAESFREYLHDKSNEREYIKSMVEDLKNDSAFLATSIDQRIPYHLAWMDSTVYLLQSPALNGKDKQIYQTFFPATSWTYGFNPTLRTLSQLHSEGFHLIRNENAVKTISLLEAQYKINTNSAPLLQEMQNDLDASAYVFADRNVVDRIGDITFKNYYLDYSAKLSLSDIPQGSIINTANKEAIQSYIEKLRKHGYYLKTAIKGQDITMLKSIISTIVCWKKNII